MGRDWIDSKTSRIELRYLFDKYFVKMLTVEIMHRKRLNHASVTKNHAQEDTQVITHLAKSPDSQPAGVCLSRFMRVESLRSVAEQLPSNSAIKSDRTQLRIA